MSDALLSNEYPRMLYGPDGATRIVASEMEELSIGPVWSRVPSAAHRKPPPMPVAPGAPAIEHTLGVSQPTLVLDDVLLDRIADRVIERLKARQSSDQKAAA